MKKTAPTKITEMRNLESANADCWWKTMLEGAEKGMREKAMTELDAIRFRNKYVFPFIARFTIPKEFRSYTPGEVREMLQSVKKIHKLLIRQMERASLNTTKMPQSFFSCDAQLKHLARTLEEQLRAHPDQGEKKATAATSTDSL